MEMFKIFRKFNALILVGLAIMFFMHKPGWAQFALEGIRQPAYAGSWYEADGAKLKAQLESFLNQAMPLIDLKSTTILTKTNPAVTQPILAIVAPHAGYAFSGQAAAYAYKTLQGQKIKRVFLLGPSHHVGFHGAALPMAVTFATPVGDLEVDKEVVAELKEYPLFSKMAEVHKVEHSLEMQLPFIKEVLGDVKIVPIVVGTLSDSTEIHLLSEILKGYISSSDLVVVSSDFTHFGPRYQYQPFSDNVSENLHKLDSRAYHYVSSLDLEGFLKFEDETKDTICGFYPLTVLMALLPESTHVSLLKYYTSSDVFPEEKDNSVSYMSIAFSGKSWPEHPANQLKSGGASLNNSDKEALLKLARGTLESYVKEKKIPTPQQLGINITEPMKQITGVFVTLHKFSNTTGGGKQSKELRGCIGHIWPLKPLYEGVIDNAISACSRDYRFNSVQSEELKDIEIEINVLTPPRRIATYNDIVLGRDGIVLFKYGHQAVFLPTVPTEFGWDLAETLTQLSKKAGLEPNDWRDGAKFDTFQSELFSESSKH